jgi:hypothetical protein
MYLGGSFWKLGMIALQCEFGCFGGGNYWTSSTNKPGLDIANRKRDIAIHGMVPLDVTAILACEVHTGVHFADQNLTLPSSAIPSSDLLIINMPLFPPNGKRPSTLYFLLINFQMFLLVFTLVLIWASHLLLLTHTLLLITTLHYPSQTTLCLVSTKNFWLDVILAPYLALG